MILIKLFLEFIKIGLFAFGSGLSTLTYIYEMGERTGWITSDYIGKILAVTQVTPGPIACNIATIVGMKQCGVLGAFIANVGFVLPAICFMGVGYRIVDKIKENQNATEAIRIVRSASLAVMIGSSAILFKSAFIVEKGADNFINMINYKNIILGFIAIFLSRYKKIGAISLILICGIIGVILKV